MTRTLLLALIAAVCFDRAVVADQTAGRQTTAAPTASTAPPSTAQAASVSAAELTAAIDKLGSFDLAVRTRAAQTARRASAELAIPALKAAALEHKDGYVRYRALVLLAGFGDASAAATMRQLIGDRNDRLRTVAYGWFEHHRDPGILPVLLEALPREQSEFVRPALLRALVAYGDDPRAREAIMPLIMRGEDVFRGVVIDALGNYRAAYAVQPIVEVAKLDGPLQDDAVTALGRIGDAGVRSTLAELQRSASRDAQPAIAAAMCLLGSNCEANEDYLKKSVAFAATAEGFQPLLRGTSSALAQLAARGNRDALTALLDAGVPSTDPARAPIALAVGTAAIRNPSILLDVLEPRRDRDGVIALLRDAFDMLASEDYELERFYVDVRRAYWTAAAGSPRRQLAEALIAKLEF
jgi:HEAT repeat protein